MKINDVYLSVIAFEKAARKKYGTMLSSHVSSDDLDRFEKNLWDIIGNPIKTGAPKHIKLIEEAMEKASPYLSIGELCMLWPIKPSSKQEAKYLDKMGCPILAAIAREASRPAPPGSGSRKLQL